jgi:tRNA G46 methylase TrmB
MGTILKDYPSVALEAEDLEGRIDFVEIFGRSSPVHIGIDTGRGTFLLNEAMARPEVNFVGISSFDATLTFFVQGTWIANVICRD